MAIAKKETFENGEVALDFYEDGRIFLTIDSCGLFVTTKQLADLHELLAAWGNDLTDKLLEALEER